MIASALSRLLAPALRESGKYLDPGGVMWLRRDANPGLNVPCHVPPSQRVTHQAVIEDGADARALRV